MWVIFALAGRVLPRIALREISKFTNTQIDAGEVDFRFNGSVIINRLVVRPSEQEQYDNSILKAETVRVHFRLGSLLRFRPRIKEIFVDDFVLRSIYDSNKGRWNLSALKIQLSEGKSGRLPLIWLENGKVEYSTALNGRIRVIARTPVAMGLRPAEKIIGGYSFDVSSAGKQSFEKSAAFGSWRPGRIELGGRISSSDLPGFEKPWTVKSVEAQINYDPNQSYRLSAKVKGFTCPTSDSRNLFAFDTKAMAEKAPFIDPLQNFFSRYNPSGKIDIDFEASGNLEQIADSTITGNVYCRDVNLCDRNFTYPVEHITGQVKLTEKSAQLIDLTGRHGAVVLAFGGWAVDSGPFWKYHLQITSDNMLLDNDLYNSLKSEEQKFWSAFSPSGVVAVNYSRSQLSETDVKSALAVQLNDINASFVGFSYPLKNTNGLLFFAPNNVVFSNVTSEWEGRRILMNGKVTFARDRQPVYDVVVNATNIPLDSTLEQALPAAQKEFYNQFETAGIIDTTIKITSPTDPNNRGTFTAEVFPKNSSVKAKVLPMLISDVTGKIVLNPFVVDIDNLTGSYGEGTVKLSGRIWPRDGQPELGYCLSMNARKIELSEDLQKNLPGRLSTLLSQLRPAGKVSITADVSNAAAPDCLPDRLIIDCLGNTIDCNFLPYPLRDISGTIAITQSQISFENIIAKAQHSIRGTPIDSVMAMEGKIILSETNAPGEAIQIRAGDFNFSGANVKFKGKTLSRVDTVLGYDAESQQWLSKYFVADFYDGKMIGKLQLRKSGVGSLDYLLEASVTGADLREFLSDTPAEGGPAEHYSTGSISGSLSVVGSLVNNSIRLGRCRLKITDMEVGELSPLAKLLQVLNLTEPSDYAFDQMLVDAYIQDDRVFFRKIDLSGKSLAFDGSGWLDLKTENINLTLTARGKRLATASPSILQSLTEGLGRAVMRVEVKGNAHDPQVSTRPLPVIKETLEILGTPKGE